MAAIAPNASFHYGGFGIKDSELAEDKYAQYLVGIRFSSFEDGNEIETETDEGHTGISNLDMGSYRKTAESAPNWEDKFRYGEGLEDIWYLTLGTYTVVGHPDGSEGTIDGVYDYEFCMPPDTTAELPLATIYNGFGKTLYDARVFNNALLNELEVTFNSDDAPTIKPTFVSDYNNMNITNPLRDFPPVSNFVKAPQTTVYVGAVGATAEQMLASPIDCFKEASFTINHNAESQACHADSFGRNTKIMGSREVTGSINMPWVQGTKYFETEYEAFNKYGHVVSEEITKKQIWYMCQGGNIHRFSDSDTLGTGETLIGSKTVNNATVYEIATGIPYKCLIKFPEVELTSVTSPKSGSDAKDLTMEYKVLEKPTQSYMTVSMVTDLEDLHIDDTGTTLAALCPSDSVFPA